jgi:hypothetical protein
MSRMMLMGKSISWIEEVLRCIKNCKIIILRCIKNCKIIILKGRYLVSWLLENLLAHKSLDKKTRCA